MSDRYLSVGPYLFIKLSKIEKHVDQTTHPISEAASGDDNMKKTLVCIRGLFADPTFLFVINGSPYLLRNGFAQKKRSPRSEDAGEEEEQIHRYVMLR